MSWVEEHGASMFDYWAIGVVVGEEFEYRVVGMTVEFGRDRFEFGFGDGNIVVIETVMTFRIVDGINLVS